VVSDQTINVDQNDVVMRKKCVVKTQTSLTLDVEWWIVIRIPNDHHSTMMKPPMTASTAVKPKLTGVEMALLALSALLLLVLLADEPVADADPLEPPELELPDGEVELVELDFAALAWKAANVLLSFVLTAKTIPCRQCDPCLQ